MRIAISCYIYLELFHATNVLYLSIVLSEIPKMVEDNIIFSHYYVIHYGFIAFMYQEKTKELGIPDSTEENDNVTR